MDLYLEISPCGIWFLINCFDSFGGFTMR
jgi:hypothetical protein